MTFRNASIRGRGEYPLRWLLVPVVVLAVVLAASVAIEFGEIDDARPVFVDSIDSVPLAVEQHGA